MGRDHTLFALVAGRVKISKKELPGDKTCAEIANYLPLTRRRRRYVNVVVPEIAPASVGTGLARAIAKEQPHS